MDGADGSNTLYRNATIYNKNYNQESEDNEKIFRELYIDKRYSGTEKHQSTASGLTDVYPSRSGD